MLCYAVIVSYVCFTFTSFKQCIDRDTLRFPLNFPNSIFIILAFCLPGRFEVTDTSMASKVSKVLQVSFKILWAYDLGWEQ